jgi:hypothetical protein
MRWLSKAKEKRVDGQQRKKACLLGLGLDNEDGHVRYTKGPNFHLFGGSEETHEEMQDKAVRFNEELKKREKRLEDVNHEEFHEIAEEIGLKRPGPED